MFPKARNETRPKHDDHPEENDRPEVESDQGQHNREGYRPPGRERQPEGITPTGREHDERPKRDVRPRHRTDPKENTHQERQRNREPRKLEGIHTTRKRISPAGEHTPGDDQQRRRRNTNRNGTGRRRSETYIRTPDTHGRTRYPEPLRDHQRGPETCRNGTR